MEDKEQVRPLAHPSPTIHPSASAAGDEEGGGAALYWRTSYEYLRRRRCALWCCGCCGATVVLLGVTILILSLTVFKVKDPELTMNNLLIDRLFVPGLGSLDGRGNLVSVNATLTADLSVKNPNVASFRFRNSTTEFYYAEETVGVAYAPADSVGARRTVRMNVTVDVLADRVVLDTNATGAVIADGGVNMSSFTDIAGRVNLLGLYKRNLDIQMNCSFTLHVMEKIISNRSCEAFVQ